MLKKFDNYDGVCFFNGLVFFTPVALYIRTQAGVSQSTFLLLQALLSVAIFIGEIPTGYITDRIGYKKSIVMSQTLMFMARFLLLGAFVYRAVWLFVVEAVVEGLANCFMSGTNSAYIYSIFGEENYTRKVAHSANYGTAGFIISTVAYAGIYRFTGIEGLMVATVIASFIAVLFSVFMVKEARIEAENQVSLKELAGMLKNPKGRMYMLMLSVFSVSWLFINFFYVEKLEGTGISVEWMSLIILGYSAVQMLAEPLIARLQKFSAGRLLVITGIVSGVVMAMFGVIKVRWIVLGFMIILPLLLVLPEYFLMEQENKLVDELGMAEKRAASLSVLNMGVNLVEILALFASAVISGAGITWCFLFIGIVIVACSLYNIRK